MPRPYQLQRSVLAGRVLHGEETLAESIAAKEQGGINDVACESVPEEGNTSKVAGGEAGGGLWIGSQEPPNGEIGDQEKLSGAQERGETDAGDGTAIAQPEADGNANEEAGIDHGN